jgi:hypothetical protein
LSKWLSRKILWTKYRIIFELKFFYLFTSSIVSCRNINCSHHGICLEGKCRCFHGYTNDDCSLLIHSQCDNRCSEHGQYVDYPKSMCICDNHWTGNDCSQVKCNIDCGLHGKCTIDNKNKCQCDEGWIGDNCQKKTCSKLCKQCDNNGNCVCPNGFTGRYCQIGLFIELSKEK